MYVCTRIENDPVEEPEELAGEAPEQQLVGGGKCPLTYLCPIHSLIHLPHITGASDHGMWAISLTLACAVMVPTMVTISLLVLVRFATMISRAARITRAECACRG